MMTAFPSCFPSRIELRAGIKVTELSGSEREKMKETNPGKEEISPRKCVWHVLFFSRSKPAFVAFPSATSNLSDEADLSLTLRIQKTFEVRRRRNEKKMTIDSWRRRLLSCAHTLYYIQYECSSTSTTVLEGLKSRGWRRSFFVRVEIGDSLTKKRGTNGSHHKTRPAFFGAPRLDLDLTSRENEFFASKLTHDVRSFVSRVARLTAGADDGNGEGGGGRLFSRFHPLLPSSTHMFLLSLSLMNENIRRLRASYTPKKSTRFW